MTKSAQDSLTAFLTTEKIRFLEAAQTNGGMCGGFRDHIRLIFEAEPLRLTHYALDAAMEAATKNWQAQPRSTGPDLFSINGLVIPVTLTRPSKLFLSGEDLEGEDEELFEKVHHRFATVNDAIEDAMIKMRKAAQASAKAELKMRAADEARRRAKGNVSAFLKDLADRS